MASLEEMLIREEREVLHAYQDHLGFWTIGVGHLIDARKGGSIPREVSRILLAGDIREVDLALGRLHPWVSGLDPARRDVLRAMAFQLGPAGLAKFRRTLARAQAGDYVGAAVEMLDSEWARQTPLRAQRMAQQFRTGRY